MTLLRAARPDCPDDLGLEAVPGTFAMKRKACPWSSRFDDDDCSQLVRVRRPWATLATMLPQWEAARRPLDAWLAEPQVAWSGAVGPFARPVQDDVPEKMEGKARRETRDPNIKMKYRVAAVAADWGGRRRSGGEHDCLQSGRAVPHCAALILLRRLLYCPPRRRPVERHPHAASTAHCSDTGESFATTSKMSSGRVPPRRDPVTTPSSLSCSGGTWAASSSTRCATSSRCGAAPTYTPVRSRAIGSITSPRSNRRSGMPRRSASIAYGYPAA